MYLQGLYIGIPTILNGAIGISSAGLRLKLISPSDERKWQTVYLTGFCLLWDTLSKGVLEIEENTALSYTDKLIMNYFLLLFRWNQVFSGTHVVLHLLCDLIFMYAFLSASGTNLSSLLLALKKWVLHWQLFPCTASMRKCLTYSINNIIFWST